MTDSRTIFFLLVPSKNKRNRILTYIGVTSYNVGHNNLTTLTIENAFAFDNAVAFDNADSAFTFDNVLA